MAKHRIVWIAKTPDNKMHFSINNREGDYEIYETDNYFTPYPYKPYLLTELELEEDDR